MRELRQRLFLRITTWLTLTSCFSVLAFSSLVAMNLSKILSLWGDDLQVTAYLEKDLDPEAIAAIDQKLKNDVRVGPFHFVPREKALKDFRVQMASYAPDLAADEELLNFIPSSFQISLSARIPSQQQSDEIVKLALQLQEYKGIEEVRYGQEWVKKYSAVLSAIDGATGLVGVILFLAALLVIGNAVRASIEARRTEIEVLELVGASSWMIRKPFLTEGALLGLGSAFSALVLSNLGFFLVRRVLQNQLQFLQISEHLQSLPWTFVLAGLVGGGLLGTTAAYLCLHSLNDGWAAARGRN